MEKSLKELFKEWWLKSGCPSRDSCIEQLKHTSNFPKKWMEEIRVTDIREFQKEFKKELLNSISEEENIDKDISLTTDMSYPEMEKFNIRLMKEIQNLRDKNTQLRKHNRLTFRDLNNSEELLKELVETIKDIDLNVEINNFEIKNKSKKGILQLSDLHLDMIIQEQNNVFDFEIASQRLKKHILSSIKVFKDNNITDIYVVNTGDTITSNRRDSEKNNRATSRARAFSIAVKLICLSLIELSKYFNVYYATCSSNESRIEEIMEYDDFGASDNFDVMLYNVLSILLENKGINFIDTELVEAIIPIDIDGKQFNLLATHGSNIGDSGIQKKIQEIKGKWASRGTLIDYVIFGDKHATMISCKFSRSGALCGGNGYSDSGLGFDSRPSQNCYIINKDKSVDGYKFDLQDVENIKGYNIENELNKFKVKRLRK